MADTTMEKLVKEKVELVSACKICFAENGGCFPNEINCFCEGITELANK